MAIEKTYFTDYDLTKIYAWLTANATGYFDSINISEDKLKITCYVGELDAFTITSTAETEGTVNFTLKAENGYSITLNTSGNSPQTKSYIRRLTKTSSGIAIAMYAKPYLANTTYTISARDGLFITKDNSGNTAFVWATLLMTGRPFVCDNSANSYEFLSCMNTKSETYSSATYNDTGGFFGFRSVDYVQLVPIGITNQNLCYLPNCLMSYYSNVLGTECQLVQGDTKYAYNGYIALKD